jgi:hypothetical protein
VLLVCCCKSVAVVGGSSVWMMVGVGTVGVGLLLLLVDHRLRSGCSGQCFAAASAVVAGIAVVVDAVVGCRRLCWTC